MIQPPGWAKHAVPKHSGWHDPRTDELLKSQRFSTDQINEYLGITSNPAPAPEPQVLTEVPDGTGHGPSIDESPMAMDDLHSMTKRELEDLGREHGIELDRRHNKDTLIEQLKEAM